MGVKLMTEPSPAGLRIRNLLHMPLDEDDCGEHDSPFIAVDHVYLAEGEAGTCCACDSPAHDPGLVGLIVSEGQAQLTPGQALVVAERLTRAASLVLESDEQPADVERDIARLAAHNQREAS